MTDPEAREADATLKALTALVTFAAALGVSGGTNLWMLATGNKLIKQYRPTLTFRSAIFGDGMILPYINTLMVDALIGWKPRFQGVAALLSVLGGSGVALMFHIGQGRSGLVNWTMPQPWRWNLLGYYHFVYMSTQFSFILLYASQLVEHLRKGDLTRRQKRDLALIGANLLAFAALLYTDYN